MQSQDKKRRTNVGNDNPLPRCKVNERFNQPIDIVSMPRRPIGLEPGSKLGIKFPHLVKGASLTKGGGAGEGL